MKTIKVETELTDALRHLSFLHASIQIMRKNADGPRAQIMLSSIERLQFQINDAIMKQAGGDDIDEAIKTNRKNG